jgi:PKD repeat protein
MRSLGRFNLLLLSLFIVLGCSFCQQSFEPFGQIIDGGGSGEPQQFGGLQEGGISLLPQPIFAEDVATVSQPWVLQPSAIQPYVTATPASGDAPLVTMLQVVGMQVPYWLWELDWDGDGDVDTSGQGPPSFQLTYDIPGSYRPEFTFYNDANQVIARAVGFFTVTGAALPRPRDIVPPAGQITASPSEGSAPLRVTLDARSIAPTGYHTWSLDQYSGGILSYPGGEPVAQVTYENPGSFNATIVFYDSQLREISRGRASILVRQAGTSGQAGTSSTGTRSQALTAGEPDLRPSGWGLFGSPSSDSGQSRPPIDLGNETNVWTPPREEFTEDLQADLQAFPERGYAPLTVRFDASGSFSRRGISLYSYDIAGGPEHREDDGYYLYSGRNPVWTYKFDKPGDYRAILDIEDEDGYRARKTKEIEVLRSDMGSIPSANLSANKTSGRAPLTVQFTAQPQAAANARKAAYAYWDFDLSSVEPPVGGDIAVYGTVIRTFNKPGNYKVGVTLMGMDRDAGPMATISINVIEPLPNTPPVAKIMALSPATGQAPLQVTLEGRGSWDGEGKIVRYTWYPDSGTGDPVINTTAPEYTYVYMIPGSYRASLYVTDQGGLTSTNDAHVDIVVMPSGEVAVR